MEAQALTSLARAPRLKGERTTALALAERAVALAGASLVFASQAKIEFASALCAAGRASEAVSIARDNLLAMTAFSAGVVDFAAEMRLSLAEALEANGDHAAAVTTLADAVDGTRRALGLTDPPWSDTLLDRAENRRVIDLAKAWGVPLGDLAPRV